MISHAFTCSAELLSGQKVGKQAWQEGQKRWYFMRGGTEKRLVTKNGIGKEKVGGTGSSSWLVENQYSYAENQLNLSLCVENQHIETPPLYPNRRRMRRRLRVSQSGIGVNKSGAGAQWPMSDRS